MTFSSGAGWGPCFFFVHARVLFKCSNLRKGTPVIDHRIWICGVGGQGERPLGGCNPGTYSMKTAWLLMGNLWVVQSTSRWHLVTHVSLEIDFSPWFAAYYGSFLGCFKFVIYLDNGWLHDDVYEIQAGCVGFPLWLPWRLHQTSLGRTLDLWKRRGKDKNKNLIDAFDICKKGLILHVNTSLILSSQHITRVQTPPFTANTMLFTSSRASRSESKQDGAELTTSDPSRQNVTNLHHKNSNHLTSAVFLLQTLSPCNNLTSLSADSPEHLWCVLSKKWENPFPPTWNWPWISNFSLVRWFHMSEWLVFWAKWHPHPSRCFSPWSQAHPNPRVDVKHGWKNIV